MEMNPAPHRQPMYDAQDGDLYELAVNMAAATFNHVTDDHVQGVYDRLIWNADHGLGQNDAATVH